MEVRVTAALDVPGATLRRHELAALREVARSGGGRADAAPVTLLVADMRPSMLCGRSRAFRSVAAAEALVLLGWQAVDAGGDVALLTLGAGAPVTVAPGAGAETMDRIIAGLVRAHDAAAALALAGRLDDPPMTRDLVPLDDEPPGVRLVIASGFEMPGAGLSARLAALSARHDLWLLRVSDGPLPERPPFPGLTTVGVDAGLPPEAVVALLAASVPGRS
ncbi:MAG: hypothetical protein CML50_08255 [Rhodobacteraceae bacterium]|nr:hypothetical protein [Paracoccaceae bacterium]